VDDPLDATPVHLGCGIWGTICVGLLASQSYIQQVYQKEATTYGLFLGGGFGQLWVQLVGCLVVVSWSFVQSCVLFYFLNKFHLLRVDSETELAGIDNTKHGGPAYPYFQQM
jgi:Amt family ammonium transporter